jgi:hypothetical protein
MSKNQIEPIVTEIQSMTQQIGGHILTALQRQDDTMGVLTSIVPGLGPDRVVSIPISRSQFVQIQAFLHQDQLIKMKAQEEPVEEKPIGFELPVETVNKEEVK